MAAVPREFLQDMALASACKKEKVIACEPLCDCPDTYVFYDYLEKYLDNKERVMEPAQMEEKDDLEGKKGKSKRNDDKCSHDDRGRCDLGDTELLRSASTRASINLPWADTWGGWSGSGSF